MIARPLFSILLIGYMAAAFAQDRCTSHLITERWLQAHGQHVDLALAASQLEQGGLRGGGIQTIPVAVHVVWNTAAENVSTATVQNVITQMNDDYQAMNSDYGNVRAPFAASRANAQIDFCLATMDPNGNATNGITRTQTTRTWFNPDTQTDDMKSGTYGIAPWDPLHYLNIWICDITSGATGGLITVGYAYLPYGGMVGSSIDGLVLDFSYGTGAGDRTATHEVGHYLGLDHPWGAGNCSPGDGISDTPPTDSPTFSCSNTNLMKCNTLTQYENFMDYSNCTMMFTTGQAAVMSGVLNGIRSELLNSGGCGTSTAGPCIPASTTGTAEGDYIDGVVLGSINNTASGSATGPTYHDYSSTWSTTLSRGGQYTINITGGNYQPDSYAAWIDYDGNATFSASEKLGEFATTTIGETQSITFTVPSGASPGNTILRVRGVYHDVGEPNPTDPCFSYSYGETEDYGITILAAGAYCIPTSANGTSDNDYIDGVQLENINNIGTGSSTGPTYHDYTSQSTVLARGATYTLSVTGGPYFPDIVAAWIDMNGDGVFDTDELLGADVTASDGQTLQFTFTVPSDAALGSTRMRVRSMYPDLNAGQPNGADPCVDFSWGETEDYTVVMTPSTSITDHAEPTMTFAYAPDHVTASWKHTGSDMQGLLMDASGRLTGRYTSQDNLLTIPTGDLASGIYQLIITSGEERSLGRFVVTR